MPRTSSQPRPHEGLLSLDDDALRSVLSFLSVADGRRGPGQTSKALRQAAASNQLARTRATVPYVLRGNTHGVVHALATSMGTRQWPTRRCGHRFEDSIEFEASSPPERLGIRIERGASLKWSMTLRRRRRTKKEEKKNVCSEHLFRTLGSSKS